MKTVKCLAVAALAAIALPALAQAQSTPRIDQRQANQEQRIDQGIASGQLTAPEAARLERGQERVEVVENKALADGTVTKKERARIERMQNRQSRRIFREKHDQQHR
jgi:uncharacterized membrane protein YebE (DUF533 family)